MNRTTLDQSFAKLAGQLLDMDPRSGAWRLSGSSRTAEFTPGDAPVITMTIDATVTLHEPKTPSTYLCRADKLAQEDLADLKKSDPGLYRELQEAIQEAGADSVFLTWDAAAQRFLRKIRVIGKAMQEALGA